jgi:hypothetical protein
MRPDRLAAFERVEFAVLGGCLDAPGVLLQGTVRFGCADGPLKISVRRVRVDEKNVRVARRKTGRAEMRERFDDLGPGAPTGDHEKLVRHETMHT